MPTGYTAGILAGEIKTFKQYAKTCMRAFGATVHLRDEPLQKEYEPRTPSGYYSEKITELEAQLLEYKTFTDAEIVSKEKATLREKEKYHIDAIEKIKENKNKLVEILNQAKAFLSPTPEHDNFKKFMIEQIEKTIEFDCNTNYHDESLIKIRESNLNLIAQKIRARLILETEKSLNYYQEENEKEIKRCSDANKWVEDLYTSLA